MNGVHDLGGMDGFELRERDQDFPLREEWEREVWGMVFALAGVPGSGSGRSAIERLPPALYLRLPYFAKWLYARETRLLEAGVVTPQELANPDGPLGPAPVPAGFRPLTPAQAIANVRRDDSNLLDVDVPARFAVGDTVRARNEHPEWHTRSPRYVRGHTGTVVTQHGPHRLLDATPGDPGPQHLYTVAFTARELWGTRGHANDTIHVELWELHLEGA